MTDLLSSARPGDAAAGRGADWSWLADPSDEPTAADLERAGRQAEQLLADHGVSYGTGADRRWRLDPVPVTVDEHEWARLDAGLRQRAELLDAVLTDLYGERRLLVGGLLPPTAVLAHPGFLREVDGLRLPGGRELVLAATDLVRSPGGDWVAVADRAQAPSGAGYAMENRRVVAAALAGVYRQASIARLGPFFHALRQALRTAAPARAGGEPRVVLLTAGPDSETAFDQAYLASMLGLPLVEGADLLVRHGRVWLRGLDGPEPVDVVLRRMDADWCDPLELRATSRLGIAGLVRALRGGAVSVVNPLGASVLENPAFIPYLPALARAVLDQDLLLASAPTWWCGDDLGREHVLANLHRLIVKPIAPGEGSVFGWELSDERRDALAGRIAAAPWRWVGQERVRVDDEHVAAVLRTYAVAHGGSYTVMAGGLARIGEGPVVSSSLGAVAKDVWVMASQADAVALTGDEEEVAEGARVRGPAISPRTAENLFWMGRYAERAEDQVRVLRAVADRWDDYHARPGSAGGRALAVLLEVLTPQALPEGGEEPPGDEPTTTVPVPALRDLLLDRHASASVARSVLALHRAADTVRDQLSNDTFTPIARIERALRDEAGRPRATPAGGLDLGPAPTRSAVTAGLRPTLDRVLEGLLAISGVAAEGLTRDVGWHLLDAGRRVERAQHVVDTLAATLLDRRAPDVDDLVLESVLLIHESAITYRRRNQSGTSVAAVLDLLVHDETNPRSLAFQLTRLRADLEAVPVSWRAPDQRDHLLGDVADLVDELDAVTVGAAVTGARRVRLAESLDSMRWRLRAAADEIERVHFARPAPSRLQEGIWGSDVQPEDAA
ncbi:MAG TPA: circularly permuted type 2 ATP-grasp protein [Cellulomonas sp.]